MNKSQNPRRSSQGNLRRGAGLVILIAAAAFLFGFFLARPMNLFHEKTDSKINGESLQNIPSGKEDESQEPFATDFPKVNMKARNSVAPPPGLRRPAEFEHMDGMMIALIDQGPSYMRMWAQMVNVFSQKGHVWIVGAQEDQIKFYRWLDAQGVDEGTYTFLNYDIDSIWIRDYGPEFLVDAKGKRYILDGEFVEGPGYFSSLEPGEEAESWEHDDAIPIIVGNDDWLKEDGSPVPVFSHKSHITGGNIMTDGQGTCFSAKSIYNYERAPGWSNEDVDRFMKDYYGCKQLITLYPICQDDTGHIDLFAKIIGPTTILLGQFPPDTAFSGELYADDMRHCDTHYPNDYENMEKNLTILRNSRSLQGKPWTIIRVPMPEPYMGIYGWTYRSYLNAAIFNENVAMPVYRSPQEDETLHDLFEMENKAIDAFKVGRPGVTVFTIPSDHIIESGGAIHCLCHEVPPEK